MTIDELNNMIEELAEQKLALTEQLINLDAHITVIAAVMTVKAMRTLGIDGPDQTTLNEVPAIVEQVVQKQNTKVMHDLEDGKLG